MSEKCVKLLTYLDGEKTEFEDEGGGPRAGLRKFSAQRDQRWSMLIGELGAVAPLTAVRKICTDRTYKLESRIRGPFCNKSRFFVRNLYLHPALWTFWHFVSFRNY
jgi:hypothetical protein